MMALSLGYGFGSYGYLASLFRRIQDEEMGLISDDGQPEWNQNKSYGL